MSQHNDGGPVFPTTQNVVHPTQGIVVGQIITGGMSLRDYFAAAALHGITNLPSVGRYKVHQWANDWAEWSYAVADAMLKERTKKDHPETNFGMKKEAQP